MQASFNARSTSLSNTVFDTLLKILDDISTYLRYSFINVLAYPQILIQSRRKGQGIYPDRLNFFISYDSVPPGTNIVLDALLLKYHQE